MRNAILVAGLTPLLALGAPGFEALPKSVTDPVDNPRTEARILLGSQLFHDTRISKNGNASCASCHFLDSSGANNQPNALLPDGIHRSRHKVPTVWNAALMSRLFWTGGAASLEEQAEGPLEEMGLGDIQEVVKKVKLIRGYVESFAQNYPQEALTERTLAKAIAAFERTLLTPDSPFDRALRGDAHALSLQAQQGFRLFQKIGCASCHSGVNFAGPNLPGGEPYLKKFPLFEDLNVERKYHIGDDIGLARGTHRAEDEHLWRVPTLRNVALNAPYFHNGSVKDLKEAIRVMGKTQLGVDLSHSDLRRLAAFLRSLTGQRPHIPVPKLPDA